jgi:hypothetical protein
LEQWPMSDLVIAAVQFLCRSYSIHYHCSADVYTVEYV